MTLEQTTHRINAAADMQDLEGLQAASAMRQEAIDALLSMPRSIALCDELTSSLEAGEKAKQALRVMKQRIRSESRRLSQIENGFVQATQPAKQHRIDYKG